jgi:8-oxo-dGTP pyrophosphatase MutT (NUDIX family)
MENGRGVKGLIMDEDRVLVLVEPNGNVDLPGGRVEEGEALSVSLLREIREETDIDVEIDAPVAKWNFMKKPGLEISGTTYLCRYVGGDIGLSHEHAGYFWVELGKLYDPDFARRGRMGVYIGAS